MKHVKQMLFISRILSIRQVGMVGLLIGLMMLTVGGDACRKRSDMVESEADFVGFITGIQPGEIEGVLGWILVESHADKLVDKYIVSVTSEALIFKRDGEAHNPADFDTLEIGQQVRIWFAGSVKKSFPGQATARQVVIIKRY